MRKTLSVVVLGGLLAASPALAQSSDRPGYPDWKESQEMMEEGAKRVLDALGLLMHAIPTYELPEVLPNGDIIIRRKNKRPSGQEDTPRADRT